MALGANVSTCVSLAIYTPATMEVAPIKHAHKFVMGRNNVVQGRVQGRVPVSSSGSWMRLQLPLQLMCTASRRNEIAAHKCIKKERDKKKTLINPKQLPQRVQFRADCGLELKVLTFSAAQENRLIVF